MGIGYYILFANATLELASDDASAGHNVFQTGVFHCNLLAFLPTLWILLIALFFFVASLQGTTSCRIDIKITCSIYRRH